MSTHLIIRLVYESGVLEPQQGTNTLNHAHKNIDAQFKHTLTKTNCAYRYRDIFGCSMCSFCYISLFIWNLKCWSHRKHLKLLTYSQSRDKNSIRRAVRADCTLWYDNVLQRYATINWRLFSLVTSWS